jgi:hypothetical protein
MILRLTDRARRFLNSDSLWCYYRHGGLTADVGHPGDAVLAAFISRNDILDDDGRPAKLVLARLRKTHKAEWYRRTNGQMEQFAVGHTAEVAANHYADIPAQRPLHEAAVAAGLQDALDATLPVRIVPPRPEASMRKAPAKADLPVPPAEVIAFLEGAQDLWLESCGGSYASPFGTKGQPCPVPFSGCLDCGNAVITSRKLPALIAFLTFMEARRETLHAADWAAKFGRAHRRNAEQILPAFPVAVVAAARTVAESQGGVTASPAGGVSMIFTPARAGAVSASLVSRHVRDSDSVLSRLSIRTGFPPAALPLSGQDQWDVTPAVFRENARRCHCSVDFAQLFDPAQRRTAKEYLYARLREPAGGPRPRLAPTSVRAVFNRLRRFMTFAESRRGQFRLDLLDQADLDTWRGHCHVNFCWAT